MKRSLKRIIGVVSVGRSDYGIYRPLLKKITNSKSLQLHLIAGGMHLSRRHGMTINHIIADGFKIGSKVAIPYSSDSPCGVVASMAAATSCFSRNYEGFRPDILVVLGDRFEMHAAALAALVFKIPVVHVHGGELTQGAIDDALRHSISKLSHLHFVSTADYARRVIQLGEEPSRVFISGALSLDNLHLIRLPSRGELEKKYGFRLKGVPPILVTFHPVTLEYEKTEQQIEELLGALRQFRCPIIFTSPNADTSNNVIVEKIKVFTRRNNFARLIENFGTRDYFGLMKIAGCMVGNSSSGIIEAASFKLPVVNIGIRQKGRLRSGNVIDVDYGSSDIVQGIQLALSIKFRDSLKKLKNIYGNGEAAKIIVEQLKKIKINDRLIQKCFYDIPEMGLNKKSVLQNQSRRKKDISET